MKRVSGKPQAGFSLVELMVAITLGVIVMGAVLASFAGSRAASRSTLGVSELTDSGRFALSTLTQAIRGAGFLACTSASQFVPQTVTNAAPGVAFEFQFPLNGYEAAGTAPGANLAVVPHPAVDGNAGDWVNAMDGQLIGQKLVAGSDVIAVHESLPGAPAYVTALGGANDFTVSSAVNLATNQLAAVSDCANVTTFVITGGGGGGANTDLSYGAGGAAPGNTGASITIGLDIGSIVQAISTTAYYIGTGTDGDGALFSAAWNPNTGSFSAQELAPDIENMQILYGIDTTGITPAAAATQYLTADLVADWTRVVSVRIALLAASELNASTPNGAAPAVFNLLGTVVTAPADSRRRQVFTTTIALRDTVP